MFEKEDKKVVSEIDLVNEDTVEAHFIGEIINGKYYNGVIHKPDTNSAIRLMREEEDEMIIGVKSNTTFSIGISPFYDNKRVYIDINNLFSNHLTILGNSGCGKSYGTAKLIQTIFRTDGFLPYKASIIMFDNNGEYIRAFENMNHINPNYHFKVITTNKDYDYKKL